MRDSIDLFQAEYKSALAQSLYEIILEKACAECSETLLNLISLACDLNQEIHHELIANIEMGGANETGSFRCSASCRECAECQRRRYGGFESLA